MDKNNLMSLKKWHKSQKRSVIMKKIKELEKSLIDQYSGPSDYFYQEYQEDDFCHPSDNYRYTPN